ncbi:Auxin-responsive SAUR protein family member [Musa troglodytarum]|uniref:Auxin-responsive SAUR protein family member n=1 Tax=Musa troglodytarum TaxID=320322 RepID=A0A9E7HDG7_9LILI|nr:Auxin-responsive SAUR protein family member [Musa troglodytarum]
MIKRWHSSSRITSSAAGGRGGGGPSSRPQASFHGDEVPAGLHAVYVGKSRRRYLVSSDLVDHPLFRVLVARTGGSVVGSTGAGTVVGCEVVLFDHLLWMLENADPPPDSLDELVDFYSC